MAIHPSGKRAYVGNESNATVSVIDIEPDTPVGPKIFFSSERVPAVGTQFHLWMMNPDGSSPQQLTFGNVEDSLPRLSPDGSRLVFYRNDRNLDPNCSNIWILDLKTGNETQLTAPPYHSFSPTWSPNGTQVAFTRGGPACGSSFSTPEIWVIPASGGTPSVLAPFNGPLGSATWTPDGASIVYVSGVGGSAQLLRRTPPTLGGTEEDLIPGPGDELAPTYSPDGSRLAWYTNGGHVIVANTANLSGTQSTIATGGSRPAWSPGGDQLVFDTQASNSFRIWKVDADGANLTQLTFGPKRDLGPWWGIMPARRRTRRSRSRR